MASTFQMQPTIDAIELLEKARRSQRGNIPFVAWKLLSRAQERLESELNGYLRGDAAVAPRDQATDIPVGRLAGGQRS